MASSFFLLKIVHTGSGAYPISYSVGTGFLLRGLKKSGREINHSPQSCAEFKNEWSYTSASPMCLHGVKRDR